jgi:hypothetical protein
MSFPTVIDNTMRKAFAGCPMRFVRRHVQGLQPAGPPSVDLHFGGAFAHAMEHGRFAYFMKHQAACSAIETAVQAGCEFYGTFQAPDKSLKTLARLVTAIRYYYEQWPLTESRTPVAGGIEMSFDMDLPIAHPDTGAPLRYVGRFDCLSKDETRPRYYIEDEKTASRLGESWMTQWELDSQTTGYIWGVQQMLGFDVEIVAQIRAISILKYECGHAEIEIVRPQWMIDRWYAQLLRDINHMVQTYDVMKRFGIQDVDVALSSVCNEYMRPCDYMILCKSANPERLLADNYVVNEWNPLERK